MNVKSQTNYLAKIVKILEELKKDHPHIEIAKHFVLAIGDEDIFTLTDKELYNYLKRHQTEMDMNTLSDLDLDKAIEETDSLFEEVEVDDLYVVGIDEYRLGEDDKF